MRTCTIPGCTREVHSHDMCKPHNDRQRRYGDPLHGVRAYETRTKRKGDVLRLGPEPVTRLEDAPACCPHCNTAGRWAVLVPAYGGQPPEVGCLVCGHTVYREAA